MKRNVFFAIIFSLFVSICFASLTIYFQDGTSRDVHKITFRGTVAELYLVDGDVITVPVAKLDLPSSGIGAPVGTYGTSKVTGKRTLAEKKEVLGSPLRQTRLREEWDRSERSATVTTSIGPMQRGDTVKIVGETTAKSRPSTNDYYDETEFWYDRENRGYRFKTKNPDHAYVIVYKNQDGTFGKRLFDAVTFSSHFKMAVNATTPAPMPEYPIIPDKKDHDVHESNPFSTQQKKPETLQQESPPAAGQEAGESTAVQQVAPKAKDSEELQTSSRRRSWIAYIIFVSVVAALGFGAWFVINRSQKPYIDASKFSRYEDDLREFEIAIWLRNGKTVDQLMEICLKKFYQDSPSVLTVCNKVLKGTQKSLVVPYIAKQTGRPVVEAERIYDQIQNQIERIRNLIREVSQKTGINPAKPAIETTPKTASIDIPRSVTGAKEVLPVPPPLPKTPLVSEPKGHVPMVGNLTSSVAFSVSPDERPSAAHLIEPEAPMRTATDLPEYANSVLNQISFLSSPDEK